MQAMPLGDRDLAWLDCLGFWQDQREHAFVQLGVDFGRIHSWAEIEAATIVGLRCLAVQHSSVGTLWRGAMAHHRECAIFHSYFHAVFRHARHFRMEQVGLGCFRDLDRRADELSAAGGWIGAGRLIHK